MDHALHERLVVGAGIEGDALGDDRADRSGPVSHQGRQSGQGRSLHLEVGDPPSAVVERLDLFVEFRIGRLEAHPASLRRVKPGRRDRDAFGGHIPEKVEKPAVGVDEIGFGQQLVPSGVLHESPFDGQIADLIAALVVVEQSVEAHRRAREHEIPDPDIGLDGPRGAQPQQRELLFLGLDLPRGEIHVGQGIELRNRNIDIADADAGREHRHAPALVGARHGVELAVRHVAFLFVEKRRHECHATRIAHQDDRVGQLLGTQVEVENRAVVVDYQFGRRYCSHLCSVLIFIIGIKVIILPRIAKTGREFFINIRCPECCDRRPKPLRHDPYQIHFGHPRHHRRPCRRQPHAARRRQIHHRIRPFHRLRAPGQTTSYRRRPRRPHLGHAGQRPGRRHAPGLRRRRHRRRALHHPGRGTRSHCPRRRRRHHHHRLAQSPPVERPQIARRTG
nr:MAG TPA: hypothetical protein [Caudoviricetes sp.]